MKLEGLVLESKYPEFQYIIKGPRETVWRDGYPIQQPRHIVLEFDRYLCEVDVMAKNQEWSDDDKEFVLRQLNTALADSFMSDMWVHAKPVIGKPWPNYDETHHNQVAVVAKSIGLVAEALTYEKQREGGPRESVVKKLQEIMSEDAPIEEIVVEDDPSWAVAS